jgi:hypothetical protein
LPGSLKKNTNNKKQIINNKKMNLAKLTGLINDLGSKIPHSTAIATGISAVPAGWHLEHSFLVIAKITAALKNSDPQKYKWKFSMPRAFVFATGSIPRGKGKAPNHVLPKNDITPETLNTHLAMALEAIKVLPGLQPGNFVEHPYFGDLNLKRAVKLLELHTKHHIKIINDIVKTQG